MRNFSPRLTLAAETDDTRNVNFRSGPANALAHGPSMSHPSSNSLRNQVPLELSNGTNDVKQELPCWGGGVDAFGQADEIDSQCTELIQTFNQVFQGASKPVELPDQNYIEQAPARIPHQGIELGPMPLSSTDSRIGIFTVADEALAGIPAQVFQLDFAVLVQGAHPSVEGSDFSRCLFHSEAASGRTRRPSASSGRESREQYR
jgi:hypothetical protein